MIDKLTDQQKRTIQILSGLGNPVIFRKVVSESGKSWLCVGYADNIIYSFATIFSVFKGFPNDKNLTKNHDKAWTDFKEKKVLVEEYYELIKGQKQ